MSVFASIGNVIKKDQYGVIWFGLLYLAVLLTKWGYLNPMLMQGDNCFACVIALIVLMAMLIPLLLTTLWILWGKKPKKGVLFLFILCMATLGCAVILKFAAQKLISKLYYTGFLNWQESQLGYLFEDFIPHSVGLFLATLMIYSMFRVAISSEFRDRKVIVALSIALLLMSSSLLVLGLILY